MGIWSKKHLLQRGADLCGAAIFIYIVSVFGGRSSLRYVMGISFRFFTKSTDKSVDDLSIQV